MYLNFFCEQSCTAFGGTNASGGEMGAESGKGVPWIPRECEKGGWSGYPHTPGNNSFQFLSNFSNRWGLRGEGVGGITIPFGGGHPACF